MQIKKWHLWIPVFGLTIYAILFMLATWLYPGGSLNHPDAIGYSFSHNFLCDLFLSESYNGEHNPGRYIAIGSHVILGLTMMSFFYLLPGIFHRQNTNTKCVQIFGVLTMGIFCFMFTELHDIIVITTAVFGTLALLPFFIELRYLTDRPLKLWAWMCYGMSLLVFTLYTTGWGFYYLPLLQKVTFLVDAVWVIWVSVYQIGKMPAKKDILVLEPARHG